MHANRSLKAMSFLNNVIGRHHPFEYKLTNQEFDIITKVKLGKDLIIPINDKYETDSKTIHSLTCPNGCGTIALHDEINRYLADTCRVELESRVVNEDNSRKRPDIIIHNGIEFDDEIERIMIDTIIPSTYI